jgi:hypothetical protein
MTKNNKESHYLIVMMKNLLNYPDTHTHTFYHCLLLCTELHCIALYCMSSVSDEEQKGISLSDRNDEKPT